MNAPLIAFAALLLTGCASSAGTTLATQTAAPTPTADPACLEVSDGALVALQTGMNEGYTVTQARAVADENSWWVAATVVGEAEEHSEVEAAWNTIHDPTVDADNAFISATRIASLVSIYAMPDDLSRANVVERTIDCLGG